MASAFSAIYGELNSGGILKVLVGDIENNLWTWKYAHMEAHMHI